MRPRNLTVLHESAHLVARFVLGTIVHVDYIEVPRSGSAGGGAAARVGVTRTVGDAIRTRADAEAEIVSTLAGSAALRELQLDDAGGEADEEMAAKVAIAFTGGDVDKSLELYNRCLERAERLVATARFQDFLLQLTEELMNVPAMSGARAAELLRGWDPQRAVRGQTDWTLQRLAEHYGAPSPSASRT